MSFMVVGLGNVGKRYEETRHNIGFKVIDTLVKEKKETFKKKDKLKAEIAKSDDIFFLKPLTYMNESGISVKRAKDFFKIENSKILVVIDDVDIPFGEFRLKEKGSCGGHKGLLSIETYLTQNYPRLRIGVKNRSFKDLAAYVLGKFSKDEKKEIPNILKKAVDIIYLWINKGVNIAMNEANIRKKDIKDEKK